MTALPATLTRLRTFFDAMPIVKLLGCRIESLDAGMAEVSMPVRPDLTFDGRAVQAGPVGALADYAAGLAAGSVLPEGWAGSTVDVHFKLVAPALGDALLARGTVKQAGTSLSVAAADVFALKDGKETLCATALVTLRNFKLG